MRDIVAELGRPGRDPRAEFVAPRFRDDVTSLDDLKVGMVLEGIVTNVTAFGAFVDVGVHQDGLVHVSQLADGFVKEPGEVVKAGQRLKVRDARGRRGPQADRLVGAAAERRRSRRARRSAWPAEAGGGGGRRRCRAHVDVDGARRAARLAARPAAVEQRRGGRGRGGRGRGAEAARPGGERHRRCRASTSAAALGPTVVVIAASRGAAPVRAAAAMRHAAMRRAAMVAVASSRREARRAPPRARRRSAAAGARRPGAPPPGYGLSGFVNNPFAKLQGGAGRKK
ncbi:MAG: S1 RNA-binding domain-containing protein [Kofleriaceae bacterium]